MFKKSDKIEGKSTLRNKVVTTAACLAIAGVLGALTIPVFIEQSKRQADSVVEAETRLTALHIETWISSGAGDSFELRDFTKEQTESIDNLPEVNLALEEVESAQEYVAHGKGFKTVNDTYIEVSGTKLGYCIVAVNPHGKQASSPGYVYSSEGGLSTSGKKCVDGSLRYESIDTNAYLEAAK